MGKGATPAVPPPLKPEDAMTDADRALLAALKIGTDDPFNAIITSAAAFVNTGGWQEKKREKFKSERDKKVMHEALWEYKSSPNCDKKAARFSVNVPNMTIAAFEHVIGDDPKHLDTEDTMLYRYDKLISENTVEATLAGNVSFCRSCYKAPVFAVAPREFRGYLSYLNLLDAQQQAALGVVPRSATSADPARAAGLRVLLQCVSSASFINAAAGAEAEAAAATALPALEPRKKHVVGTCYHYMFMGQEEVDGSLTLTFVVNMDPQGSLPAMAVDAGISEQLEKLKAVVRLCEKEAAAGRTSFVKPYVNTRDFLPV